VNLLFSPHNDDEAIFASYVIAREHPLVVVCFRGAAHYGAANLRAEESRRACAILGASFEQWDARVYEALIARMRDFDRERRPDRVWAPDEFTSHTDHIVVSCAAREVFRGRLTTYCTYAIGVDGAPKKVTSARPSLPAEPQHVLLKLRAMACYESQICHPRAGQFFTWSLDEWLGEDH
jgi:LmbE family N-acetylglucosaminyl deacetylase